MLHRVRRLSQANRLHKWLPLHEQLNALERENTQALPSAFVPLVAISDTGAVMTRGRFPVLTSGGSRPTHRSDSVPDINRRDFTAHSTSGRSDAISFPNMTTGIVDAFSLPRQPRGELQVAGKMLMHSDATMSINLTESVKHEFTSVRRGVYISDFLRATQAQEQRQPNTSRRRNVVRFTGSQKHEN
ncbi:hypothetical protein CA602_28405 [Paraburkholderia hospita]|nr:hypothetical protein CA602_28405 [Paraburkholderia hospita]